LTNTTDDRPEGAAATPFDDGEMYDAVLGDIEFDRGFYLDLARRAGGPVLEVACGTGRILLPCLAAGADVEGVDLFPAMLERLRAKAAALGLAPRLHVGDMRDFRLRRRYALLFCAFNGFVHCLTAEDQLRALRTWRRHLRPGGCAVFNVFYPGREVLGGPEGTPVLELETRHPVTGRTIRMLDTRTLDRVAQVQHSEIEIQELDGLGNVVASHRSATDMRWTFKPEMELLLRAAGFPRFEIFGGFDLRPLERDDDQIVVFAYRDGTA